MYTIILEINITADATFLYVTGKNDFSYVDVRSFKHLCFG